MITTGVKVRIIKPPHYQTIPDKNPTIFLAGSIEQGKAVNWQERLINDLSWCPDITVFNPRREDWDNTWEQSIEHTEFNAQVTWEMDHLEKADVVVVYFDPATKSPITIGELYMVVSTRPKHVIVYCPEGFYRKGNVDILCANAGVPVHTEYNPWLKDIIRKLEVV